MLLKVQRPLESNEPNPPFLVYAQGRRFMTHVRTSEMPADVIAALGADLKGYFEAEREGGQWRFGRRVADQGW
jgi:hypothetical protein